MTQTVLPAPANVHWGYFDASLKPVATIDSGETIIIKTVSGEPDAVPTQGGMTVRPELQAVRAALAPELGPHILTGPLAVRGAMPGDALRVEIVDIELADDWGWNIVKPGMGTLPDDFPYERRVYLGIDRVKRTIQTPWGMSLAARPFFGVMGVAPAREIGRVSSVMPSSFGGNIDNKELGAGAVLYLPVAVEGALFSCGDGHALQGDGEVCLTAVETGLTGTFKIDLVKDAKLDAPYAETATHLIAMAFDEDLDEAARIALRRMIALIVARTTLTADDAYRLCSLAADLRVTQLVNRSKGIHVMIPHAILNQSKR
ncbi:acetamidase/formamidase family protein [Tardiphaga sp.]|uniref:acetamidase/formamidase family protein n=1 Tax=Tardiphaga sp. TaxID=1926292 RepID=UPI0026174745|nr:acetamidase/formamidase family protein [Tardiphaga sp.]MDB5618078.1 amidase [Tardiphaga sp.]